ncbi:MAG TPA: pyridoxamine 5'-phosphate oxidase family protein [Candidatus Limnocylindrales bacterium]|nr:pyridoxamine 5'-phosphate oxidase family protein [Candidatus Limnocylindrales bacterium]
MATWSELAAARPELMARARDLFLIEQPDAPGPAGLGYLATIRADGGPRVHPISPAVLDGHLYAFVLRRSPKSRDLERDPRFALHSWPLPFGEDSFDDEEVAFTGRAVAVKDEAVSEQVARAVGDDPASGVVFELHLESALHKHRQGGLTYEVWREDGALS